MEKLRRVLAGQDDEEQGLTAQVRPGESPLSLPFPSPPGAGRAGVERRWSLPAAGSARGPWLGRCRAPRAAFPRARPAHTHTLLPGPAPPCQSGADTGRQRRDQSLRHAPWDGGLWAAGSALRMSFGELLSCEAFGCAGGLGSFGFYKVLLCFSREFEPDNILRSFPT